MKKALITLVVLGALAGAAWAGWRRFTRKAGPTPVPTLTLTKERFVRKVTTEGALRAVKATPLSVPPGTEGGPMKLAWLADDGALVKQGDVVVRFDQSGPERQLRDGQADLEAASARLAQEQIRSQAAVAARDATAELAAHELATTRQFQQKDSEIFSRND